MAPNASKINQRGVVRKVKKSEIIHHENFKEASDACEDDYWRDILLHCARKKFPKGFCLQGDRLKFKKTGETIELPDDVDEFLDLVIDFFKTYGRLYSDEDLEAMREENDRVMIERLEGSSDWSSVSRSKVKRRNLVMKYVRKRWPDENERNQAELYTQINVGFEIGYIKKEHIEYIDREIQYIDGIELDGEYVIYTRKIPNVNVKPSKPTTKIAPNDYFGLWTKYMNEEFEEIVNSSNRNTIVKNSRRSAVSS